MYLRLVKRTPHTLPATVQYMSVDHCRTDVLVTEQFLHGANVCSRFKQVRSKAMPESVAARCLLNTRLSHRLFHSVLQHPVADVVAQRQSRPGVAATFRCGKNKLPDPFSRRVRILARQCGGKMDGSVTILKVLCVE